jgi:hypothetical protein
MYDEDDEKRFPRITLWQFLGGILWRVFALLDFPQRSFTRRLDRTSLSQERDNDAKESKTPPADTLTRPPG